VTDIKTGANSGAFDFDGVDDTLDLGTVADSDQSLTLMEWAKLDNTSSFQRLITKRDSRNRDSGSFILSLTGTGELKFSVSTGVFSAVTATKQPTANQYFHVAARYNFQTGTASVFVNGQFDSQTTVGQTAPLPSQPWRIGTANPDTFNNFVDGTIDGARIYQAALSDSDINQIYLNTEP